MPDTSNTDCSCTTCALKGRRNLRRVGDDGHFKLVGDKGATYEHDECCSCCVCTALRSQSRKERTREPASKSSLISTGTDTRPKVMSKGKKLGSESEVVFSNQATTKPAQQVLSKKNLDKPPSDSVTGDLSKKSKNQINPTKVWECSPDWCVPGECIPKECYKKAKKRNAKLGTSTSISDVLGKTKVQPVRKRKSGEGDFFSRCLCALKLRSKRKEKSPKFAENLREDKKKQPGIRVTNEKVKNSKNEASTKKGVAKEQQTRNKNLDKRRKRKVENFRPSSVSLRKSDKSVREVETRNKEIITIKYPEKSASTGGLKVQSKSRHSSSAQLRRHAKEAQRAEILGAAQSDRYRRIVRIHSSFKLNFEVSKVPCEPGDNLKSIRGAWKVEKKPPIGKSKPSAVVKARVVKNKGSLAKLDKRKKALKHQKTHTVKHDNIICMCRETITKTEKQAVISKSVATKPKKEKPVNVLYNTEMNTEKVKPILTKEINKKPMSPEPKKELVLASGKKNPIASSTRAITISSGLGFKIEVSRCQTALTNKANYEMNPMDVKTDKVSKDYKTNRKPRKGKRENANIRRVAAYACTPHVNFPGKYNPADRLKLVSRNGNNYFKRNINIMRLNYDSGVTFLRNLSNIHTHDRRASQARYLTKRYFRTSEPRKKRVIDKKKHVDLKKVKGDHYSKKQLRHVKPKCNKHLVNSTVANLDYLNTDRINNKHANMNSKTEILFMGKKIMKKASSTLTGISKFINKCFCTMNFQVNHMRLEPYECEPGFCIPGRCNPFDCQKRIQQRNAQSMMSETGPEQRIDFGHPDYNDNWQAKRFDQKATRTPAINKKDNATDRRKEYRSKNVKTEDDYPRDIVYHSPTATSTSDSCYEQYQLCKARNRARKDFGNVTANYAKRQSTKVGPADTNNRRITTSTQHEHYKKMNKTVRTDPNYNREDMSLLGKCVCYLKQQWRNQDGRRDVSVSSDTTRDVGVRTGNMRDNTPRQQQPYGQIPNFDEPMSRYDKPHPHFEQPPHEGPTARPRDASIPRPRQPDYFHGSVSRSGINVESKFSFNIEFVRGPVYGSGGGGDRRGRPQMPPGSSRGSRPMPQRHIGPSYYTHKGTAIMHPDSPNYYVNKGIGGKMTDDSSYYANRGTGVMMADEPYFYGHRGVGTTGKDRPAYYAHKGIDIRYPEKPSYYADRGMNVKYPEEATYYSARGVEAGEPPRDYYDTRGTSPMMSARPDFTGRAVGPDFYDKSLVGANKGVDTGFPDDYQFYTSTGSGMDRQRQVKTADKGSHPIVHHYDAQGRKVHIPHGHHYDSKGRRIHVPHGHTVHFDSKGRKVYVPHGAPHLMHRYDSKGRKVYVRHDEPLHNYDAQGRKVYAAHHHPNRHLPPDHPDHPAAKYRTQSETSRRPGGGRRTAVHVNSKLSFNVELYKGKSEKPRPGGRPSPSPQHAYQAQYRSHAIGPSGQAANLRSGPRSPDMRNNGKILKRCFCTLKLNNQQPYTINTMLQESNWFRCKPNKGFRDSSILKKYINLEKDGRDGEICDKNRCSIRRLMTSMCVPKTKYIFCRRKKRRPNDKDDELDTILLYKAGNFKKCKSTTCCFQNRSGKCGLYDKNRKIRVKVNLKESRTALNFGAKDSKKSYFFCICNKVYNFLTPRNNTCANKEFFPYQNSPINPKIQLQENSNDNRRFNNNTQLDKSPKKSQSAAVSNCENRQKKICSCSSCGIPIANRRTNPSHAKSRFSDRERNRTVQLYMVSPYKNTATEAPVFCRQCTKSTDCSGCGKIIGGPNVGGDYLSVKKQDKKKSNKKSPKMNGDGNEDLLNMKTASVRNVKSRDKSTATPKQKRVNIQTSGDNESEYTTTKNNTSQKTQSLKKSTEKKTGNGDKSGGNNKNDNNNDDVVKNKKNKKGEKSDEIENVDNAIRKSSKARKGEANGNNDNTGNGNKSESKKKVRYSNDSENVKNNQEDTNNRNPGGGNSEQAPKNDGNGDKALKTDFTVNMANLFERFKNFVEIKEEHIKKPEKPPVVPLFDVHVNTASKCIMNEKRVMEKVKELGGSHEPSVYGMADHGKSCRCCVCKKVKIPKVGLKLVKPPLISRPTYSFKPKQKNVTDQLTNQMTTMFYKSRQSPEKARQDEKKYEILKKLYEKEDRQRKIERLKTELEWNKNLILKHTTDCQLVIESITDILRFLLTSVFRLVGSLFRAVLRPRHTYYCFKDFFQPHRMHHNMKDLFYDTGIVPLFTRVRTRLQHTNMYLNAEKTRCGLCMIAIFHPKRMQHIRKHKQHLLEMEKMNKFQCHILVMTLRKHPCVWIYNRWPWLYPHFIALFTIAHQFKELILFTLAVFFWSPIIIAVELCKASLCCLMCTG